MHSLASVFILFVAITNLEHWRKSSSKLDILCPIWSIVRVTWPHLGVILAPVWVNFANPSLPPDLIKTAHFFDARNVISKTYAKPRKGLASNYTPSHTESLFSLAAMGLKSSFRGELFLIQTTRKLHFCISQTADESFFAFESPCGFLPKSKNDNEGILVWVYMIRTRCRCLGGDGWLPIVWLRWLSLLFFTNGFLQGVPLVIF